MTQDKARKSATRQRMAETGEPYSEARRAVERDRDVTDSSDPQDTRQRLAQARERFEQADEVAMMAHDAADLA